MTVEDSEARRTRKLRCAASANAMTHDVTHASATQIQLGPAYRRHLQRLVRLRLCCAIL
jgi:hypothetical protein